MKKTIESLLLSQANKGATFYTEKDDKHMTALAIYYKREIKTQRIVAVVDKENPSAVKLTRVKIIS